MGYLRKENFAANHRPARTAPYLRERLEVKTTKTRKSLRVDQDKKSQVKF